MKRIRHTITRWWRHQSSGTHDPFGRSMAEAFECGRQQGRREVIHEIHQDANN